MNSFLENPVHCIESEYMKYVKYSLEEKDYSSSNSYKTTILNSILKLYEQLETSIRDNSEVVKFFNIKSNSNFTFNIYPFGYSIPSTLLANKTPPKSKSFSNVIPGNYSTYISNERDYLFELSESLFVVTYKKAGWDCLRHYEIIAAGSIPLFVDIEQCPHNALPMHPKELYRLLLYQPGLQFNVSDIPIGGGRARRIESLSFDDKQLDQPLYTATVEALLHYARNVFSTRSMATYLLQKIYTHSDGHVRSSAPKVLYLTHTWQDLYGHTDMGDFQADLTLIGLKEVLGEDGVIDYPKRKAIYRTHNEFNTSAFEEARSRLYGKGFVFGLFLSESQQMSENRNPAVVEENIKNHVYDVVIVGTAHVMQYKYGLKHRQLPFFDLVCEHYHPKEVALLDGYDWPTDRFLLLRYNFCAAHVFSREGWNNATRPIEGWVVMCRQARMRPPPQPHLNLCPTEARVTIYLIENGLRRPFHSQDAFLSRGFDFKKVKEIEQEEFLSYPEGPPLM